MHTALKAIIEALGIEACNLIILAAVVSYNFASPVTESRKVVGPGPDVAWVESLGCHCVTDSPSERVPRWVTQDDISEPVLGFIARQN